VPSHWTYAPFEPASDLEQGDFLLPTPELHAALTQAHRHFTAEKYLGFVVITQTCDLVRRPSPAAPFVAIAAVRSLRSVLPKLLRSACDPWNVGIFPESRRDSARKLLERLFNQNEQALGVFYFHPDADLELGEPAVALLRVSVALRTEHYDALLTSRRGRLRLDFQAKLGWLVANLYGRAASADWGDAPGGKEKLAEIINGCLADPLWANDEALMSAKTKKALPPDVSVEDAVKELERLTPPEIKERVADEAVLALQNVARHPKAPLTLTQEQLDAFRKRFVNGRLGGLLKPKTI
jgi:hypothetical protein